ncbi:MAG: CinA family nicotinamide mononucleotide deamidase-related protein, partial [Bacteroidota bacterium]
MTSFAEIITIGDEILYGQTLDTNSHWLSSALDEAGIQVTRKTSIADKREEILEMVREAETRADIILLTGGLGPTNDDLTKPTLVEYFDTKLVHHPEVLTHIQNIFVKAGREMSELNMKQADLPENCTPIHNAFGTAPGMWFEKNGKVIISMPGVPFEMKKMMTDEIIPKLVKQFVNGVIYHKIIRTVGVPESKLAQEINGWENNLPKDIRLAYLPTMGMVKLRLTAKGADSNLIEKKVSEEVEKVMPLIEKYVFGFDEDELEVVLGKLLLEKGKKLALAESCTGGYLSHMVTSVPGSSQWFNGSFIPYSNQLKNEQLDVGNETL